MVETRSGDEKWCSGSHLEKSLTVPGTYRIRPALPSFLPPHSMNALQVPPLVALALVKCYFGHLRGSLIKPTQCLDASGFHARLQMPVACLA